MAKVDYASIAHDVYAFASTDDAFALLVKETLQVIDDAFDTWGYVISSTRKLRHSSRTPGKSTYL